MALPEFKEAIEIAKLDEDLIEFCDLIKKT